jgi:hypothetical protein
LKPSNVISTTRAGITDEVFVELGSNKALEHLISRQKKRFFGNVDVADTLSINLPDSFTILRGQSILLYDSRQHRIGEKDVVLVFSHASVRFYMFFLIFSIKLLEVLKKNKRWQIDGTFACAATQWVQNFTVAAEVNKKMVVCAQSLLPGKHTKYYIEVLNSIKNAIQPHTPQQFMSDFECASLRALEQVFPDASKSGCMFHMSQALFRKWRRLGMEEIYADPINGELARKTFRNVLALALIPQEEVRRAFQLIVRNAPIGLQSFLGYFAQNYIGLTRIQQEDGANAFLPLNQSQSPQNVSSDFESEHSYPIQFGIPSPRPSTPSMATTVEWDLPIVRQPRFSIKFWNINERVRSSLFRTNNSLESAHLQFGVRLNIIQII